MESNRQSCALCPIRSDPIGIRTNPWSSRSIIEDASEDCSKLAELYRRRASDRIIEKHYDAMVAKRDRNLLYRISMEREMQNPGNAAGLFFLRRVAIRRRIMSGISVDQNPSSGAAGHADAGVVPGTAGVVPGTAGARNSRTAASSSNVSIRVESGEAVNVEPAGGSQPSSPKSQAIDDPVLSGGIDLEAQTYSNHDVEDSSGVVPSTAGVVPGTAGIIPGTAGVVPGTEYRVHRVLFGNEANTGVAVRNVIELSGASSYGVVPPLVWIGFLASLLAPSVRTKWPGFAKDLSLIGHISTAWWHLVLLSTKYHSEQYAFANTTLTALFCIVIALALIRAGR